MFRTIGEFFESIKDKKVALIGLGVTNTPLAGMLISHNIDITICDKRDFSALGEAGETLKGLGARFSLGEDYLKNIDADIIFRTPGMRFYTPELDEYRKKGVIVTSEMEVLFDTAPCKIIAVTGSNGKTTTSSVIAEMLKNAGKKVWLGGNIGKALLPGVPNMKSNDVCVVELSSFQLISMRRSPDIALITNLSPNHLDMHKDMQEYADSKRNIFLHQSAFDTFVSNDDCPLSGSFSNEARGKSLTFSRTGLPYWGAFCDNNGDILFSDRGSVRKIMNKSEIKIPGMHNVENYLAAICCVQGLCPDEAIVKTARKFGGVHHRAELVRTFDGVSYYNDSIATTPARVMQGLLSLFDEKIILIAGGYDKKIPFDDFGPAVCQKVKTLILMGITADKIEDSVKKADNYTENTPEIIRAGNLEEAVGIAGRKAHSGDIVALSPACASFDMYPNFEARGEHFTELVNGLK